MKDKLKTLKDLEVRLLFKGDRLIEIDKIKAEAVKDIKAIRHYELLSDDVETYIKWKFNLTEEDLK